MKDVRPFLNKLISFTFLFLTLAGCSLNPPNEAKLPYSGTSFADYQKQCNEFISENRHFVLKDKQFELIANSPFEFNPLKSNGEAILFVHGLGDSPWTFRDIGRELARNGYLVRAILLPGNGTKPADMLDTDYEDWRKTVEAQLNLLSKSSKRVWLGGFSTGCNLVTKLAFERPEVKGLVLFSPAFEIQTEMIAFIPLINLFTDWYKEPDNDTQGVAPFRYETVPLEAIEAFRQSMVNVQESMKDKTYSKPVIVMMTEHDSVINAKELIHILPKVFTNPKSRFIWYGTEGDGSDPRIIYKSDYIPEERIASFSHMSLAYSPKNPWYGRHGKSRVCRDDLSDKEIAKCEKAKNVWYSTWESAPDGKITARLMYNPYFNWQKGVILSVMREEK